MRIRKYVRVGANLPPPGLNRVKHLENTHGGKAEDKSFADYFEVRILKAYKKPFTMCDCAWRKAPIFPATRESS